MEYKDKIKIEKSNQPSHMRPIGRGPGSMNASKKAKNFKQTMLKLLYYLKPYWISIVFVLFFAIGSTVFTILGPKILGNVTNTVVDGYIEQVAYDKINSSLPQGMTIPEGTTGSDFIKKLPEEELSKIPSNQLDKIKNLDLSKRPSINYEKIISLAIELIIIYLLGAILAYIQGWIMSGVTQKITYKFRKDISKKINRLPLRYFDSQTHGEILSRITNDVTLVSQTLNQSLTQIVTSVALIAGFIIMMLTISWEMTLVAILILPLSMIFISTIIKKSQIQFKAQQDSLGKINGHIEEMYSGHNVMKVFNGEKRSIAKFNIFNKELYTSGWKSQFLSGLMYPIMNFFGNVGYVGISVLGGYLAIKNRINIGDIQAFIQYVRQFNQPIVQTANVANVIQSTAAAAERVFEFLDEEEEEEEEENMVEIKKVKGEVEFENVKFGYKKDEEIIHGASFKVKPGQKIAIVGPTGAGKTTLVNLLMRFYEIDGGSIKIDGVDSRKIRRENVRKLFGMVLQDTWLFNGTIRENISYGKPKTKMSEIKKIAKASHVDHIIRSLPKGYNAMINEETDNISQGEKQLLTIARAMLSNPSMLILDEATSSVDTRTELLIEKAMEKLMKNKTSFIIAHRLSTIRNADLILVMNEGNIVEQGTHKELLSGDGFYASLYNAQFLAGIKELQPKTI